MAELIVVLANESKNDHLARAGSALLELMFVPFYPPRILRYEQETSSSQPVQSKPQVASTSWENQQKPLRERPVCRSSRGPYDEGSSRAETSSSAESNFLYGQGEFASEEYKEMEKLDEEMLAINININIYTVRVSVIWNRTCDCVNCCTKNARCNSRNCLLNSQMFWGSSGIA